MGHRLIQRRFIGEGTAEHPPTRVTGSLLEMHMPGTHLRVMTPHVWPCICILNKPPYDPDFRSSVSSRGARSLSFCINYPDFRMLAWIFKTHCKGQSKELWVNLAMCFRVLISVSPRFRS